MRVRHSPRALVAGGILSVLLAALAVPNAQVRDPAVRPASTPTATPGNAGLATITGTVVTEDATSKPVGRAIVTVAEAGTSESHSATTDDTGHFVMANVPSGRLTITAMKPGYVPGAYGAKHPGRPGTSAVVTAGQTFDATIRIARAAVLTGTLTDEHGGPIAGAKVFAVDASKSSLTVQPGATPSADTDDRGTYRIFDLAPATYIVVAGLPISLRGNIARRSTAEVDRVFTALRARNTQSAVMPLPSAAAFAVGITFYPGTAALNDATRIAVAAGDVREGLDFTARVVPVTTIRGTVVSTEGPLPATLQLTIAPPNPMTMIALADGRPVLTHPPGPDGVFEYGTITPGHYVVLARATNSPAPSRGGTVGSMIAAASAPTPVDSLFAAEELDVSGSPASGVVLRLQRGSRFSGRIAFVPSPAQPAPTDLTGFRVNVQAQSTDSSQSGATRIAASFAVNTSAAVHADGTFEVGGIGPGIYRITCTTPPTASAWRLGSAVAGSTDLLDTNYQAVLGADVTNATLMLSDARTTLSGTLQASSGVPAPEYYVLVFPADPTLRTAARRVMSARPATDGRFEFADLPAGNYLLAALTDVEPYEWQRVDFLRDLASSGVPVRVISGENATQDLRIR